jgi:GTP-binding protein HflX
MLPRLAGRGSIMRQQGGIGVRGPGEPTLEVDRRVIRNKIARLQAEIENIRRGRQVQRQRRSEGTISTVALVGYTNAGKSSLLNRLTSADVFVEDKLFATLDPRARRCRVSRGREVVLTDTVGFIRKLPHSLVAAFRATLEEVKEADLLLLVADAAHPAIEDHIRAVYDVLEEIGALDKPMAIVLNKIDIADADRVGQLSRGGGIRWAVSARTGEGCETLLAGIERLLGSNRSRVRLRIPQSEAGLVARVYKSSQVFHQGYDGNDIVLEAEIDATLEGVLAEYIACV